jgi:hypothetical protein
LSGKHRKRKSGATESDFFRSDSGAILRAMSVTWKLGHGMLRQDRVTVAF